MLKKKAIIISKKMRKIIQICRGDVCAFYVEEVKILLYSIMNKKHHKFRLGLFLYA